MADEGSSNQLLSGFWWLESHSFRWTARDFTAALKPPEGAEARGATVYLHLYLPDTQIETLGPMTLSASAGDRKLLSETFSKGGNYVYACVLPKELMATTILPVKFHFDRALSPQQADGRELAAIVTGIELQTD
jgi:hypothetical protein